MSAPSKLKIRIDGASRGNPGPAGVGVVLENPRGGRPKELYAYLGEATNNVAETMALILGLQEALRMRVREAIVLTDSELLARQVTGDYRVKDRELKWLHVLVKNLTEGFNRFEIRHVPRTQNRKADRLANKAVMEGIRRNPPRLRSASAAASPQASSQPTFW